MLAESACGKSDENDLQSSKAKNNGSLNRNGGTNQTKSTVPAVFRSQKVHPLLAFDGSFEFTEVRPGRTLRIYRSHSTGSQKQRSESQSKQGDCTEPNGGEILGLMIESASIPHDVTPPDCGLMIEHESASNPHDVTPPDCANSSKTNLNNTEIPLETMNSLSSNDKPIDADLAGNNDTKESDPKEFYPKRSTTASSIRFHMRVAPSSSCSDSGPTENQSEESLVVDTAMFLLHGVGGSVDIWNLQISYFEKLHYEIVALDFVGHGLSSSPHERRAYTFKEMSEDILAIFDRFRKTKNIVVGHSYGCCFSTLLARYRSRFITKLVLISGGSPLPLLPEWNFRCLPLCILSCCQRTLRNIILKRSFYSPGYSDSTRDAAFSIPSHVLKYVMNGQDWLEGNIEFHSWITIPTLLIHGKHDRLVSAEEVNLMNQTIPGSQLLVVEDAGHMVMIERSEKVNQMIHDFLLTSTLYCEDNSGPTALQTENTSDNSDNF